VRVQETVDNSAQRQTAGEFFYFLTFLVLDLAIHSCQAVGQRQIRIFIARAHHDGIEQILERHGSFALQRTAIGFQRFGDAYGINNDK